MKWLLIILYIWAGLSIIWEFWLYEEKNYPMPLCIKIGFLILWPALLTTWLILIIYHRRLPRQRRLLNN